MSARHLFNQAYRLLRTARADISAVNALYTQHRDIYRAAGRCYVAETAMFTGWVNNKRRREWRSKLMERMLPNAQ